MAVDLSNIFGIPSLEAQRQQPSAPDQNDLIEALKLDAMKEKIQQELQRQRTFEGDTLKKMGVSPETRAKELTAEDKPKGFWKTLGKYGAEAVRGATQGASYVPYSDRMLDRAYKEHQLETPRLRETLGGITDQINGLGKQEIEIEKILEKAGFNKERIAQAKEALRIRQQGANTADRRTDIMGSRAKVQDQVDFSRIGVNEANSALTDRKRRDLGLRMGLTGETANGAVLAGMPDSEKVLGSFRKLVDEKNKSRAENAPPKASSGSSLTESGKVVDPNTGLPLLFDRKSGQYSTAGGSLEMEPKVTGENAGAASRSAAGYNQTKQVEPLIDKLEKSGKLGLVAGTWNKWKNEQGLPDDPDMAELVGYLKSISSFTAGIHGQRAVEAANAVFKNLNSLGTDAKTMKAALKPVQKALAERSLVIPGAQTYMRQMGVKKKELTDLVQPEGAAKATETMGAGADISRDEIAAKLKEIKARKAKGK